MKKNDALNNNIQSIYGLSPLQEGMLYHKMTQEDGTEYVLQHIFNISDALHGDIMQQSLTLLSLKYDVLRTVFFYRKSRQPLQVVLKTRNIEYLEHHLTSLTPEAAEKEADRLGKEDVQRGFDLEKDSLFRLTVVRMPGGKGRMFFTFHHIIVDGWCLPQLLGNFMQYYEMLHHGMKKAALEQAILAEKKQIAPYRDFIDWLEKQDHEASLSYWKQLLANYPGTAQITPLTPEKATNRGLVTHEVSFSSSSSQQIRQLAVSQNMTINIILEAAWGLVMQKYCGCPDVVFGKVISGRDADLSGIEQSVGLYINTIPVRVTVSAGQTVLELLQFLKSQAIDSTEHGFCSLTDIQHASGLTKELFSIMFVFENYYVDDVMLKRSSAILDRLSISFHSAREQTNYALSASAFLVDEQLTFRLMYDSSCYTDEEMHLMGDCLRQILTNMAAAPETPVSQLSFLDSYHRKLVLQDFNQTLHDYPRNQTAIALFESWAARTPDAPALRFQDQIVTFGEMNAQANCLAHQLRKMHVNRDTFVMVMGIRCPATLIGWCAVLKAGGAYLPLDPNTPEARIQFILEDSKPTVILAAGWKLPFDSTVPQLDLTDASIYSGNMEDPPAVNTPQDLMNCIYTSGTTGKPKGVMITHQNIMRVLVAPSYATFNQQTVALQSVSMSFDPAGMEIWGPLLNGGSVCLVDSALLTSPALMRETLKTQPVSTVLLTTSLFNHMIDSDETMFGSINQMIIGGEKISERHVRKLRSQNRDLYIINAYGPTENSIITTYLAIPQKFETLSIGCPVDNTQIYIVQGQELCGVGMPGELCIGGDGLARGYLNRPELTAERFVAYPFAKGRLYRSGDLARWLPDGTIEYMGRLDEQVKIRGFRIELGEIQSALRLVDSVKDAAVIVGKDASGDDALYAYLTGDEPLNLQQIRLTLGETLPYYMVPTYMTQMEQIPVTINGKLNKAALPTITADIRSDFVQPRNKFETVVANTFAQVLGLDQVGIQNDFLELGGDSLKAIRVIALLKEQGYDLSVSDLMQLQNPSAIAVLLKDGHTPEEAPAASTNTSEVAASKDSSGTQATRIYRIQEGESPDNIKELLKKELKEYDKVLTTAKLQAEYTPIYRQRSCLEQPQIMTVTLEVEGNYTPDKVNTALNQVLEEQSALRTTYLPKKDQFREYKKEGIWSIPCFDTAGQLSVAEHLIEALLSVGPDEQLYRTSPLDPAERLLAKQIMVRLNPRHYRIHLYVDHSVWDLKSSELWGKRIQHFLDGGSIEEILPFSFFAKEAETVVPHLDQPYLHSFSKAAHNWNRHWQNQPVCAIYETFPMEQASQALLANPLGTALALVQKSMHAMCLGDPPENLPFLILYHNRNEANRNVAGLFPDLLPITLPANPDKMPTQQQMEQLLTEGQSCLYWNEKLSRQLKTVADGIPIINVAAHFVTDHNHDLDLHLRETFDTILKDHNNIYPLNLQMRLSPSTVTITMFVPESARSQMKEYLSSYINNR